MIIRTEALRSECLHCSADACYYDVMGRSHLTAITSNAWCEAHLPEWAQKAYRESGIEIDPQSPSVDHWYYEDEEDDD